MKDNQQADSEATQELAEGPEVTSELSKVASNPKRNIAILAAAGLIFAYILFQMFKGSPPSPDQITTQAAIPMPTNITKPSPASSSEGINGAPAIPDLPKLEAPSAPPTLPQVDSVTIAPPPPPSMPTITEATNAAASLPSFAGESDDSKKRLDAKRKSSMILVGGKEVSKTEEEVKQEKDFTKRGDMSFILGKGKILAAVIETAVNTDFGGDVRAVIVRDVYSESGNLILIPKGSKVFGNYSKGQKDGSARIDISWSRIDLPSGYSLNFGANTIDSLGRKGIEGRLDNKYQEQMANAVLTSAFNIALASAMDKLVPPVQTAQSTAQTTALTAQINSAVANATTQNANNPQAAISAICGQMNSLIPATSAAFTTVTTACMTAQQPPVGGGTYASNLATLITAITNATSNISQTAATNSTPTQTQAAATQAVTDLGDSFKNIIDQNKFTPNVTLDQGQAIKIYVNQDYVFPKAAVGRARVIK